METTNGIKVVVRLRPLNKKETGEGTLPVVTSNTQDREVTLIRGSGKQQVRRARPLRHRAAQTSRAGRMAGASGGQSRVGETQGSSRTRGR